MTSTIAEYIVSACVVIAFVSAFAAAMLTFIAKEQKEEEDETWKNN